MPQIFKFSLFSSLSLKGLVHLQPVTQRGRTCVTGSPGGTGRGDRDLLVPAAPALSARSWPRSRTGRARRGGGHHPLCTTGKLTGVRLPLGGGWSDPFRDRQEAYCGCCLIHVCQPVWYHERSWYLCVYITLIFSTGSTFFTAP